MTVTRDMGDELRKLFPVTAITEESVKRAAAASLRWQHENVIAEMVNGLRWLGDTEWHEWPRGEPGPRLCKGTRAR